VSRFLLDTHIFLWYITADSRLPASFQAAIQDSSNDVYLSAVSVWEAVIKHSLGKLSLPRTPAEYLPQQRAAHGINLVSLPHSTAIPLIDSWLLKRCSMNSRSPLSTLKSLPTLSISSQLFNRQG